MGTVHKVVAAAWYWYATMCGLVVTAGLMGWLVVSSIAGDNAVIGPVTNLKTWKVQTNMGGDIIYSYDISRHENCPGDVVNTYHKVGSNEIISVRRAANNTEVQDFKDVRVTIGIPTSVTPGKWVFESGIDSVCPTRKRYDELVKFEIEVTG